MCNACAYTARCTMQHFDLSLSEFLVTLICIFQMDIIYAASPLILWSSNKLFPVTRIMLLPILDYANNATAKYGVSVPYNLTWAPHYLGHWPSKCWRWFS